MAAISKHFQFLTILVYFYVMDFCLFVCRQVFEQTSNPCVSISLYSSKLELVEASQDFVCPAVCTSVDMWWGYTYHMQTPLENIEDKCFLIVQFSQLFSSSGDRKSEQGWSALTINKATIDTGDAFFELVPGAANLEIAAKSDQTKLCSLSTGSAGNANKRKSASGGLKLDADLVITRRFRACDIENYQ
jgi:hypothetical protein